MIEDYLAGREGLEQWQRRNLCFHAGQLYAFGNEYSTAKTWLERSRNVNESEGSPIRWNAYVAATIAFLDRDLELLKKKRDKIAAGPELNGKIPNLGVVDSLIANFERPYSEAYSAH